MVPGAIDLDDLEFCSEHNHYCSEEFPCEASLLEEQRDQDRFDVRGAGR